MKTKFKSMLPWKPIAITAASVVSFTAAANAAMTVSFVYDSSALETIISYSGSWSNYAFDVNQSASIAYGQVASNAFFASTGNYSFFNVGGLSGSGFVTGTHIGTVVGDSFGWDNVNVYAPFAYVAGDLIEGSLTVAKSLADLGLTVGDSGSFVEAGSAINANRVDWSVGSVVPEPSSAALLFGASGLGVTLLRRRRR